jgi:hypothetical protein
MYKLLLSFVRLHKRDCYEPNPKKTIKLSAEIRRRECTSSEKPGEGSAKRNSRWRLGNIILCNYSRSKLNTQKLLPGSVSMGRTTYDYSVLGRERKKPTGS